MREKKITVSIPYSLYWDAQKLTQAGYFSSISELIRTGIRTELKEIYSVLNPGDTKSKYLQQLTKIQNMIQKAGGMRKSEEEIIRDLRRIREEVWNEKYAARSG